MESKKSLVFEKTREILSKYELTGVSKNELIRELQNAQVASRMTVLEYMPEMTDPKRANIIDLRVPKGKITPICYPTKSNLALVKLKEKFKFVNKLLDLIENNPVLGDCFIPIPKLERALITPSEISPDSGTFDTSLLHTEMIHSKKTSFGQVGSVITLRFHKARHDLLKELPLFLTWYLNNQKMNYSKQVKEESIRILTSIFLRALRILHADYSSSLNLSKQAYDLIQKTAPKDSVVITELNKSPPMPHTEVEFLNILGRYYYSISKQFAKNMKFDSCKEQMLISNFIQSFYRFDLTDDDHDTINSHDIESIERLSNDLSLLRGKEDILKTEYGFEKNSIPVRLGLYNSDALHIKTYYVELFLTLGLFNKRERVFLNHVLIKEKEKLSSLKS